MRRLIIIPDSANVSNALKVRNLPALEAYEGALYEEIRRSKAEGKFPFDLDVLILTSRYGFKKLNDKIGLYRERMTLERARELRQDAVEFLLDYVRKNSISKVYVMLGENYIEAIAGFDGHVDIPVEYIVQDASYNVKKLKEIIAGRA
ncbi:MAG: hypothetical protein HY930_06145 [Euryarchaeota archaeon]|nr:hypothetical protein [Euryarchaeota archaeon]